MVLTSNSGPKGSWTVRTPNSLAGATVSGIPVQVAQTSTAAWSVQQSWVLGGNNASALAGPLYPHFNGYNISAGDCSAESSVFSSINALPGGTASATVPLGLLPLKLVFANGAPAVGATVTLTATSCGVPGDTYNMPVTDATGVSTTSVPYGTYTYSVTVGGVAVAPTNLSVNVGPNTVKVTNSNNQSNAVVTTFLPSQVQVLA